MTEELDAVQETIRTARPVRRTHVQAVAGAGKTRVLIDRAQYLVGQHVDPRRIWFLVFSKTADRELRERLAKANLGHCKTQTLHAFCRSQLDGPQRLAILDDTDAQWRAILTELRFKHGRFRKNLQQVLEETWRMPMESLSADRRGLRASAEQLIRGLDSENVRHLTLSQLLIETHEDWKRRPHALTTLQEQFGHLIVDEVQDISPLQAELVEQLAGDNALLTVGDRNQAIFRFQGATPDVIQGFRDRATVRHSLDVSYRCPAQHALVAEGLTGQAMVPARGFQGSLSVHHSSGTHLIDTLQSVVQDLVDRPEDGPVAVLAATNREVEEITGFLKEVHLVAQATGKALVHTDQYCRNVLWPVVRFLVGRDDGESLRGPNPLLQLAEAGQVTVQDRDILHAGWRTQRHVSDLPRHPTEGAFNRFIRIWQALYEWSGALHELPDLLITLLPGHPNRERELARHLCVTADSLEELQHRLIPQAPGEALQVVVSTIHAAKGKQWSRVVLYDAGPTPRIEPPDDEREEAIRLRYVAITRSTRDLVAILGPDCHPAYMSAFGPAVVDRILRLEAAFAGLNESAISDHCLATDLSCSPSMQRYVRDFSAFHVTSEVQKRMEQLLGIGEADSKVDLTNNRFASVQRIPLTGFKRENHH